MTTIGAPARTTTYRTDVIGSLLRPAYLKAARARRDEGAIGPAEFKRDRGSRGGRGARAADRPRGSTSSPTARCGATRSTGISSTPSKGFDRYGGWAIPFRDEQGHEIVLKRPVVVAKLRRVRPMCTEEFAYARGRTDRPLKVTLINAQQAAAYYDAEKSRGAYATIDAYLADVVDILRAEVDELVRLGCTYIQLDAPQYAGLIDPAIREGYRKRGTDPDKLLDRCIELDNAVIGDHPGVTFGIHLCRGNNQSKFYASGGYEPVARVFERTRFQRFLLEYDDERSGGFEPLAHVPEDRTVVLGLVTTKKPALESEDDAEAAHRGGDAASCRWSGWRSARSAASPRPRRGTRSPRATRRPSCASSPRWRARSGASRERVYEVRIPRLRSG